MLQLIECPRDAMQGIKQLIDTKQKIKYLNQLLNCGFHTIDIGSFVSPKAIPQMADTSEVLSKLDYENCTSKLLTIVANLRGAEAAIKFAKIDFIGYPFSISETFQMRNTNSSIKDSLLLVKELQALCVANQKQLVVYVSMGFGNPYGDAYSPAIAEKWCDELAKLGIKIISISDTIGMATPTQIADMFSHVIPSLPQVTFGAHLHTLPVQVTDKLKAAFDNGCIRFDGAIGGYGGCPMATDDLTGNMPTELMLDYFQTKGLLLNINVNQILKLKTEFNKLLV
jgi:hydroxymethylglutaryl-CoA lyase